MKLALVLLAFATTAQAQQTLMYTCGSDKHDATITLETSTTNRSTQTLILNLDGNRLANNFNVDDLKNDPEVRQGARPQDVLLKRGFALSNTIKMTYDGNALTITGVSDRLGCAYDYELDTQTGKIDAND